MPPTEVTELHANTGDEPQRVAVEAGDKGVELARVKSFKGFYAAEAGERVEWVVEPGESLYARNGTAAGVDELEPRGLEGRAAEDVLEAEELG